MFYDNGYPKIFFDKALEKCTSIVENAGTEVEKTKVERNYILGIPYVGKVSHEYKKKITSLVKESLDVDIFAYYTSCKISQYFSLKSKTPFALKANVVYKFACLSDSDTSYIGKTKRHIAVRVKEHITPTESKKSEIKSHIFDCHTCKNKTLSVDDFSIMKSCRDDYTTRISEALFIKRFRPRLNKQLFTKGQSYLLRVF